MLNISEETKQKILEAIIVIEDDDHRKSPYKEVIFIRKLDSV